MNYVIYIGGMKTAKMVNTCNYKKFKDKAPQIYIKEQYQMGGKWSVQIDIQK